MTWFDTKNKEKKYMKSVSKTLSQNANLTLKLVLQDGLTFDLISYANDFSLIFIQIYEI